MAYLGAQPNKTLTKTTSQSFNGTGSATTFTLNRAVNTEEELEVFVENVQQEPGSGKSYTASGTTLTFDEAPPSGTGNIYVIYRGLAEVTTRLEHDANQALSATTGTFSGAFTSPGIDDNANATAITIDSSENVLVNTTGTDPNNATASGDAGVAIRSDGRILNGVYQDFAADFNRINNDGEILRLSKDGSTVGSIASRSSGTALQIYTSNTGIDFAGDGILPMVGSTITNNSRDIGSSSYRFKDLYIQKVDFDGGGFIDNDYAYLKSASTTNTSLTLRKDSTGADSVDFFQCRDDGNGLRLVIEPDGDVKNVNNSYGATSDQKLKENIADAASQWDDIKAVQVRKYSLIADDLDAANQIGVIAQELETAGMNGLVSQITDIDEDGNDLGTTTKTVKYSVLYMKAVKALQEAMTRIETLETKVAALEGN